MDVDNQNTKMQTRGNAPLDANGQLTQPMKKDVKQMLKDQKSNQYQWGQGQNPDNTYGTDSNGMYRSSYRSSAQPYNGKAAPTMAVQNQSQGSNGAAGAGIGGGANRQNLPDNFNIFDSKEISDQFNNNGIKGRKLMLAKIVEAANVPTLQLKVLSSAHLEKDFTLLINPVGIVPQ